MTFGGVASVSLAFSALASGQSQTAHGTEPPQEACPPGPQDTQVGTWTELLDGRSRGYRHALVVCLPADVLAQRRGARRPRGAARDGDRARNEQGLRAAQALSPLAPLVGACVLILSAEACHGLQPQFAPPPASSGQFPAVLLFHAGGAGGAGPWRPHRRSRFSVRRMNNCGLQAECLFLDLADVARADGGAEDAGWSSLRRPWPGAPKLAGAGGGRPPAAEAHPFSLVASPLWSSGADAAAVPSCLAGFMREVVRLRPASTAPAGARQRGLPVLVLHHRGLPLRERSMRGRLRAAGLEPAALFLEMEPDHVNDSVRACLGPRRRKSMDSMSEDPRWRYPTRGEDSLAVKHLAAAVWLLESGQPAALVLEDDAWFSQHLAADLDALLAEARLLDWDVVAVGTCYHHRTPFGQRVLPHLWLAQVMPCAHAYLLSRKGAQAVLGSLPLELPIDLQISGIAQGAAPYEELRRGSWAPGRHRAEIFWAEPQLAFQWPEDTMRSVEDGAGGVGPGS